MVYHSHGPGEKHQAVVRVHLHWLSRSNFSRYLFDILRTFVLHSIRKHYRRLNSTAAGRQTEPSVNSFSTSTMHVTRVQLSDADDKSRGEGEQRHN